jgi:enoyl-CoA hydratase
MSFETFLLTIEQHVAQVKFNRPEKSNALNDTAWREMSQIFQELDQNPEVRVIVLAGEGKHFCAGIDLSLLMGIRQNVADDCEGRLREKMRQMVFALQAPINAIEQCRKPVLAAVHGGCIGAGVDIISACDMRYSTETAYFSVKEIDMGMVADLGTLQRLPKIIPAGVAREMAYTGRNVYGPEAQAIGLVNRTFADQEALTAGVLEIATTIASKSPLSIRGTKEMLNYARDHSVADGLNYIAVWNAAMILSDDLNEAFMATMQKRPPVFKQ